ncbi:MAG: HAMP domain-containing histidine kinase [Myxococcales bacterium]|nr:MAG: HAMP domain-containing histidine kinase [Myxococcales bacterium]
MTALILGGSFLAVSVLVRREETADLDQAIAAQAGVAVMLAQSRVEGGPGLPGMNEHAGRIPEIPMLVRTYEALYSHDGALRSSSTSFGRHPPPTLASFDLPDPVPLRGAIVELKAGDEQLRGLVLPIEPSGDRLLFALTRRSVDDDLRFLWQLFAGLFLVATGLTALIARWLAARLVADVDILASTARAVAGGDLAVRVDGRARGSTELRLLGDDLDDMIAQLDALVASQRTFISHAAHELRSPLATLRGELQLALRRPRSGDEYREAIEEVLGEVEQLIALAEDLLVLARQQGVAATTPRRTHTALGDALADALRLARGPAEAHGVTLVEPPATLLQVAVRGARPDLARAIRNLLDNAITHSPRGGSVRIEISGDGDQIHLAVCDEGPGVPAPDAQHLFAPFFRGSREQSGEQPGAGLGLAIVREIVQAVGGSVWLDVAHSPGARFVLGLPLALS